MTDRLLLLDASALVELVIDGEHRQGADVVLDQIAADPRLLLTTAAHGLIEAISAIRRLDRQGLVTADAAERAIAWLQAFDLSLDPTGPRAQRIWELRHVTTAYDAAYAAAAEALGTELISTDSKLLRACDTAGIPARHL